MDSVLKMKYVLREFVFEKSLQTHSFPAVRTNVKMLIKFVLMANAGTNVKYTIYALANPLKIALDINTALSVNVLIQEDVLAVAPVTKDSFVVTGTACLKNVLRMKIVTMIYQKIIISVLINIVYQENVQLIMIARIMSTYVINFDA